MTLRANEFLNELEADHREWLSVFDARYLRNFDRLHDADYEAAMTEAAVRRLLASHGIAVEPNEDLTGSRRSPDFRCLIDNQTFYVEATCVSIEKTSRETGLPHPMVAGPVNYGSLNNAFFHVSLNKASQCGNLDHAALVAVATFHTWASSICVDKTMLAMLLTGETNLAWNIDVDGQQVGETYQVTNLRSASFLRPLTTGEVGYARSSISGMLVCGVGVDPPHVIGVLHPNPEHGFDPRLLPGIEFGSVALDRETRKLEVTWAEENDH